MKHVHLCIVGVLLSLPFFADAVVAISTVIITVVQGTWYKCTGVQLYVVPRTAEHFFVYFADYYALKKGLCVWFLKYYFILK